MRIGYALAAAAAAAAAAVSLSACGSAEAADPLSGTTWQLVSIESMAPAEQPGVTIDDPAKYTVTFGTDGRAAFRLDCNRGTGTWQADAAAVDSGSLTFGPIGVTRMFCPQPSVDTTVAADLAQVRSYLIADGKLNMSLMADGGILRWQPQPAAPS